MRTSVTLLFVSVLAFCVVMARRTPHPFHAVVPTTMAPVATRLNVAPANLPSLQPAPVTRVESPTSPTWEERFCEIANQPVALQSQEELEELADSIPEGRLEAALNELSSDRSSAGLNVGRRLVWRWAEKSPEAAAQWVAGLADNDFAHMACGQIVNSWAGKDLNNSLAWVQKLPDGGNKAAASIALADEAGRQNQAAMVMALAANLPSGSERSGLLDYSVRQWAMTDAKAAAGWVQQSVDGDSREQMLGEIATVNAIQDPFQAADFVATVMSGGPARDGAVASVVQIWAAAAPRDAAAWVQEFPDGGQRDALVANLVETWAKGDFDGARAWVNQLPDGAAREAAVTALGRVR